MTNQARYVCAASDLVGTACPPRASPKKSLFDMARIHPYAVKAPPGTGRAISFFPMTRSGSSPHPTVRGLQDSYFCSGLILGSDSFKDETDQTAAEYYVVPVNGHHSFSRSSSEARSTPSSSTMDLSVPGPNTTVPHYIAESRENSRSNPSISPQSEATPISQPRLANVNEAYLLRHFQRHLADWVSFALSVANHTRHINRPARCR